MRNSDEKSCSATSIANQSNSTSNGNTKIRIAVLGQHDVGKSALTVRYLTRRYIGEYKSNTDLLYRQTVTVGHTSIDVEIVDISASCRPDSTLPVEEFQRADGYIIVYSITDRSSFNFALETLEVIMNHYNNSQASSQSSIGSSGSSSPSASPQPRASCPILLVANKTDLEHLRTVEKVEGLSASMQYGCQFYELSTADNSPEVYTSFQSLISTFVAQNSQPVKRKFSVSKMLGNLRIGRSSPSHQIVSSQASIVDTNFNSLDCANQHSKSTEQIPLASEIVDAAPGSNKAASTVGTHFRQSSSPELTSPTVENSNTTSNFSIGICHLKSKLVELHSIKKRQNSPPICSL